MATGKVTQVIGTVVDVEFPAGEMPAVFNAVETQVDGEKLVLEVEQHVGNNWVRCLALGPTDGLKRGARPRTPAAPSPSLSETRPWVGCSMPSGTR